MRFYHYTTALAAHAIQDCGMLNPSAPNELQPGWVCLTTDPDCQGHGLHDGRPIDPEHTASIPHHFKDDCPHCFDHTQCRLVMDIRIGDLHLVRAVDHHSHMDLISLDVLAWHPATIRLEDAVMWETLAKLANGELRPKSSTWWYYKKPIPLHMISGFEHQVGKGLFHRMPPGCAPN